MALHDTRRTSNSGTLAEEANKMGWTARTELDTWLANYDIDPEALGRNEQVLLVTTFRDYWREWFESPKPPNVKTSTTLGEFTRLLSVLAR